MKGTLCVCCSPRVRIMGSRGGLTYQKIAFTLSKTSKQKVAGGLKICKGYIHTTVVCGLNRIFLSSLVAQMCWVKVKTLQILHYI